MGKQSIETIGKLVKKERFRSVLNETNSDRLILENMEPYPGYHGTTVPDNLEPDSLFVITKINYNDERVIRAIQSVKSNFDYTFDAAPGTVRYQNRGYHFIRFKSLPYNKMGEVLDHFRDAGIEFRKHRKVNPYETIIEIRKFIKMEETIDGVYQDLDDKNTVYIYLPKALTWANFEKITMSIKYNLDDRNFDCAQTSIYTAKGVMDSVRVFDMESCQGKLIHLKQKYMDAISSLA